MFTAKDKQEEIVINSIIQLLGSCCNICKNNSPKCDENIKAHEGLVTECIFFEKI